MNKEIRTSVLLSFALHSIAIGGMLIAEGLEFPPFHFPHSLQDLLSFKLSFHKKQEDKKATTTIVVELNDEKTPGLLKGGKESPNSNTLKDDQKKLMGAGSQSLNEKNFSGFMDSHEEIKAVRTKAKPLVPKDKSKNNESSITIAEDFSSPSEPCTDKNSFGGIGIHFETTMNPGDRGLTVKDVPHYYPAYLAGIRPGDQIISNVASIKGEVGTYIVVQYLHNNLINTANIKREKICYKTKSKP